MSPYSYAFTADYTAPASPAGLVLDTDEDAIAITAVWDPSEDDFHYEYLVEAQYGDGEWFEIGRTTDESFYYYLAPLNKEVRIRVSDSNGSQYSDPTEDATTLDFEHWALSHVNGEVIEALENDMLGTKIDLPLDQRMVQPLSGPATGAVDDPELPIIYTGKWQGERFSITFYVPAIRNGLIASWKYAARLPQGEVALKDPDGNIYLVALGGISLSDAGNGDRQVTVTAVRVA